MLVPLVSGSQSAEAAPAPLLQKIHKHARETNKLRTSKGYDAIKYRYRPERHPERRAFYLRWWQRQHRRAIALERRYPWTRAWYDAAMCIHSHEGAWNDPNPPYWGGMQMDLSFQQAYGPEFYRAYGTADHWPPVDQLIASYRAWQSRGWTPWPNTARYCAPQHRGSDLSVILVLRSEGAAAF